MLVVSWIFCKDQDVRAQYDSQGRHQHPQQLVGIAGDLYPIDRVRDPKGTESGAEGGGRTTFLVPTLQGITGTTRIWKRTDSSAAAGRQ